jgi:hypothetical protein
MSDSIVVGALRHKVTPERPLIQVLQPLEFMFTRWRN